MMSSSVVERAVKLCYDREITRIALATPLKFQRLQTELRQVVAARGATETTKRDVVVEKVTYFDEDGDEITISSTRELEEACRVADALGAVLKLHITARASEQTITTTTPPPAAARAAAAAADTFAVGEVAADLPSGAPDPGPSDPEPGQLSVALLNAGDRSSSGSSISTFIDQDGDFHIVTHIESEPPVPSPTPTEVMDVHDKVWAGYFDFKSNRTYWYNKKTGITTWNTPKGVSRSDAAVDAKQPVAWIHPVRPAGRGGLLEQIRLGKQLGRARPNHAPHGGLLSEIQNRKFHKKETVQLKKTETKTASHALLTEGRMSKARRMKTETDTPKTTAPNFQLKNQLKKTETKTASNALLTEGRMSKARRMKRGRGCRGGQGRRRQNQGDLLSEIQNCNFQLKKTETKTASHALLTEGRVSKARRQLRQEVRSMQTELSTKRCMLRELREHVQDKKKNAKQGAQDAKKAAKREAKEAKKEMKKVEHHGVQCDRCGVYPITGLRFKCVVCDDYDLCMKCEKGSGHNADHPVLKMKTHVPNFSVNYKPEQKSAGYFVDDVPVAAVALPASAPPAAPPAPPVAVALPVACSSVATPAGAPQFTEARYQLVRMGFPDNQRLDVLLSKHAGNVVNILEELLV